MTTRSDSILFISGAGLQPWVWDGVRGLLDADSVVATRPAEGMAATLLQYAQAALRSAPAGTFTVIAHSVGGVVAAEVARIAPERVGAILAVAATVPAPGRSFTSSMPIPQRWVLAAAMRVAGTRPPEGMIRGRLCEGLPGEVTDRIVGDFTAESRGLYADRVAAHVWPTRRGYLHTTRDRELAPAQQRRFAARLDPAWTSEVDAGHLPMLEDPAALTDAITNFSR